MKLIIDRSKWRSGDNIDSISDPEKYFSYSGKGDPALLNEEGYMCCLGFLAIACELSRDDIFRVPLPGDLDIPLMRKFPRKNGEIIPMANLVSWNDNPYCSREEREENLIREFENVGIQASFIGEYDDYVE